MRLVLVAEKEDNPLVEVVQEDILLQQQHLKQDKHIRLLLELQVQMADLLLVLVEVQEETVIVEVVVDMVESLAAVYLFLLLL
jgi:hypothetical protein